MKKLLEFILKGLLNEAEFSIEEEEGKEEGKINLKVKLPKDLMGIVIGKNGQTIRAIQNILKIKGRLEGKKVFVQVEEKS